MLVTFAGERFLLRPVPAYARAFWEGEMRIDPEMLQSVAFIGVEGGGQFVPLATAAIVATVHRWACWQVIGLGSVGLAFLLTLAVGALVLSDLW